MKTLLRRLVSEWEQSLLWMSVLLLAVLILTQLAGLLREREGDTIRSLPAPPRHSYLNEGTAFAFLQPPTLPPKDARNPFAFSCKFPPQAQAPDKKPPWRQPRNPQPPPPAAAATPAAPPEVKPAPPAPPKRVLVVLYRGLYRSADAVATDRRLAFVSAKETPSNASSTQVLAEGQTVAGITVKRFSADELVVSGPLGGEVTIPIGKQQKIPLE